MESKSSGPSDETDLTDSNPPLTPTAITRRAAKVRDHCNLPPVLPSEYRHVRKLRDGGQGKVYLAVNAAGEQVAVKMMDQNEVRSREEMERLKSLGHHHLVGFRDWIPSADGNPFCYLVMEYVEGESLDVRGLTDEERPLVFQQVAAALAYIHAERVIHRDVKPANIVVSGTGEGVRAVLVDLGVAKRHGTTTGPTRTLEFVGTPSYSSPEQLRSAKHVTSAADVFSLGVCIYESITHRLPYASGRGGRTHSSEEETDPSRLIGQQLLQIECVRPKPIVLRGGIGQIDMLVRAMIHVHPDRRPESTPLPNVLIDAFAGRSLPVSVQPESWSRYQARRLRRHWVAATVAATVAFLLAGSGAWVIYTLDQARRMEEGRNAERLENDKQAVERAQRDIEDLNRLLSVVQRERYSPQSLKLQGTLIDQIVSKFAPPGPSLPQEFRQPIGRFFHERAERQFDPTASNLGNVDQAGADVERAIALFSDTAPAGTDRDDLARALLFRARLPRRSDLEATGDLDRVLEIRLAACNPQFANDCLKVSRAFDASADVVIRRGELGKADQYTDKALAWVAKADAVSDAATRRQVTVAREMGIRRRAIVLQRRGKAAQSMELIVPVTEARRQRFRMEPTDLNALRDLLTAIEVEIEARTALDQHVECESLARELLEMAEVYRKHDPDNSEPATIRLSGTLKLVTSLRARKQFDQAVKAIDETRPLRDTLQDASPPLFRRFCADLLYARGMSLAALNKKREAMSDFREAEQAVLELQRRFDTSKADYALNGLHGEVLFRQGLLLRGEKEYAAAEEKLLASAAIRSKILERDQQNQNALKDLFDTKYTGVQVSSMTADKLRGDEKRSAVWRLRQELLDVAALIDRFPPDLKARHAAEQAWASDNIKTCDRLLKKAD